MSDSPYIFDISAENFEQIVINGSFQVPVLVDFWADWCQPCKMLMPLLAKLVEEYQGRFILAKINTEEQQAVAMQFGIRSIPTVKLFSQGQEIDEFAGALPESEIRSFLDRHLPRESDNSLVAAEQMLAQGDTEAALKLLSAAQAADPSNPRILFGMARLHLGLGDFAAANAVLDTLPLDKHDDPEAVLLRGQLFFAEQAPSADEINALELRLEENPKDSEALYKLAIARVLQQQFEEAIDQFLQLMMSDREYAEDGARTSLLKLFDMLGEDPLVAPSRRRMFNLMH